VCVCVCVCACVCVCVCTGSSDQTLRVWNVAQPDGGRASALVLRGHTSRIWDISTAPKADLIASASGDASIKIWGVEAALPLLSAEEWEPAMPASAGGEGEGVCKSVEHEVEATATLSGHKGDVYAVCFHPEKVRVCVWLWA